MANQETAPPTVLGLRVDCVEADGALRLISTWAAQAGPAAARGRYVCAANVHMVMEGHDDPSFRDLVNVADLVVADGQPVAWALRLLGAPQQRRVRVTPDLLLALFAECARTGVRVGLYGGRPDTLAEFRRRLLEHYPALALVYAWPPPFRPLTAEEDARAVADIEAAGVQLLLVGIGCPRQERWMAAHRAPSGGLTCVQIGVGAAFDMLGGRTRNAPGWMQERGLEWLFRLASEPRRLWRRQVRHNPRFVVLFARQALRARRARRDERVGTAP